MPAEDAADVAVPDPEAETSQRITLIEFTWTGRVGTQPVIFVSREWLQ